jgi:hypothetical protein
VSAPEEIEMDSVEVNLFENPHYSFDAPTLPTESATNEIELQRLPGASLNDLNRLPTVVSLDSATVVSASFLAAAAAESSAACSSTVF